MALDPQRLRTTQKTLDKLLEHFKGEPQLVCALEAQDVSALAQVAGISERRAVELVLAWKDREVRDLIQSEQGQRIYESIIEKILAFANTDSTRNRVRLLRPLASEAGISELERFVICAKKDIADLPLEDVAKQLKHLKPLAPPSQNWTAGSASWPRARRYIPNGRPRAYHVGHTSPHRTTRPPSRNMPSSCTFTRLARFPSRAWRMW